MAYDERWLVTGATGLVGSIVSEAASRAGVTVVRASLNGRTGAIGCDLRDPRAAARLLEEVSPDCVIHLAALARPALAQDQVELAYALNVQATAIIAAWCQGRRRRLLFASTDQVFSGVRGPYRETDTPSPATIYGETKLAAERLVIDAGGLVARLGWVLNDHPAARPDFIEQSLSRLKRGETVEAVHDEHRTPVYGHELSLALLRLAQLDLAGAVHVAGSAHATPYDLLRARARQAGLNAARVRPISRRKIAPVGRPRDVRLDTSMLQRLIAPPREPLHA